MRYFIPLLCLLAVSPLGAQSLPRFVDAQGAWSLMGLGATVLDSRPASAYGSGHLMGARNIAWDAFSDQSDPLARGRLNPDTARLSRQLKELGVRADRPVLVYGEVPGGWG